MALLHDPKVRDGLRSRVVSLRPDATRRWGKMTVDQMLWHVNQALSQALTESRDEPHRGPLPLPLLRFATVNLPWPKGAPTHPAFVAGERYDFDAEKARCLTLLDGFAKKDIDEPWPVSPSFGRVNGRFMSRLQAKHVDHHLKQFSA